MKAVKCLLVQSASVESIQINCISIHNSQSLFVNTDVTLWVGHAAAVGGDWEWVESVDEIHVRWHCWFTVLYTVYILCAVIDSIWEVATVNPCLFASLPASSLDCIKRVWFNGNINTRKTDIQGTGSISAIFKHLDQIVIFSGYIVGGGAPSWGSAACSCISTLPGDTDGHECEELHIAASNRCKQHYTDQLPVPFQRGPRAQFGLIYSLLGL